MVDRLFGSGISAIKHPRLRCLPEPNLNECADDFVGIFVFKYFWYASNCGFPIRVRDAPESRQ